MEKELPKDTHEIYNYRHQDILFVREELKRLGIWKQDPDLINMMQKFGKFSGMTDQEIVKLLTPDEMVDFAQYQQKQSDKNELILDNLETILKIHDRIIKPEYTFLFEDNDMLKRDCLFRVFLPRVRG